MWKFVKNTGVDVQFSNTYTFVLYANKQNWILLIPYLHVQYVLIPPNKNIWLILNVNKLISSINDVLKSNNKTTSIVWLFGLSFVATQSVGDNVGTVVGSKLGSLLGLFVGTCDGNIDGISLGSFVGIFVG